jgi:hypothetical protein
MKPKDHLIQLKLKQLQKQYPTFPPHAIPKPAYSDKTANGLSKMVCDFLNLSGHEAHPVKNTGTPRIEYGMRDEVFNRGQAKKITWTAGNIKKGIADISSTIKISINGHIIGLHVEWEIKIGKDTMKPEQRQHEADVKAAGGEYFVIKTFDDFYAKFNELIKRFQ